jgi:hypothetical protein
MTHGYTVCMLIPAANGYAFRGALMVIHPYRQISGISKVGEKLNGNSTEERALDSLQRLELMEAAASAIFIWQIDQILYC